MTDQPTPETLREQYAAAMWAKAEHTITAEWICCEPLNPKHDLCAQGYAALRMTKALIVDDPKAATSAPLADAVLAVRDQEMEQLRADLVRVQQAACRTAENLRHAVARAEQAEGAIERVRQLCELTIGTSVRVQAVQQAYDTLAAFDEPQQPAA